MKKVLTLIITTILLGCNNPLSKLSNPDGVGEVKKEWLFVNAENGLNLRKLPSSSSIIIKKLNNNDKVEVIEKTNVQLTVKDYDSNGNFIRNITDFWVRIKFNDINNQTFDGYVFQGYLDSNASKMPSEHFIKEYIKNQIKKGGGGKGDGCFECEDDFLGSEIIEMTYEEFKSFNIGKLCPEDLRSWDDINNLFYLNLSSIDKPIAKVKVIGKMDSFIETNYSLINYGWINGSIDNIIGTFEFESDGTFYLWNKMFASTSNSGKWCQVSSDEIRLIFENHPYTYGKGEFKTGTIKMHSNKKKFYLGDKRPTVYRRVGNRHSN